MVTNTTYQAAPWADVLVFHDKKWWKKWRRDVQAKFGGQKISRAAVYDKGVRSLCHVPGYGNSGGFAAALALLAGVARIVYLGLDCKPAADGRRHWHGAHPQGLGDAMSMDAWPDELAKLAEHAAADGVEIINSSRDTALTCFPRVPLEEALA